MDPLTHFIIASAAGYILAGAAGMRIRGYMVPVLAVLALFIDVDHLLPLIGVTRTLVLHNIAFVAAAGLIVYGFAGRDAGIIFSTMLAGHLLFDMNSGIYGIPIAYPLSGRLFLIPKEWELGLFGYSSYPLISRTGLAATFYSIYVLAAIHLSKRRET
jgi:hypothetical protein